MSDTNTPPAPSTGTFYRIEGDPPQCVAVEMESRGPGPAYVGAYFHTNMEHKVWGMQEGRNFCIYSRDESLAANGYASSPDGAWELAEVKIGAETDAHLWAYEASMKRWIALRDARDAAKKEESDGN